MAHGSCLVDKEPRAPLRRLNVQGASTTVPIHLGHFPLLVRLNLPRCNTEVTELPYMPQLTHLNLTGSRVSRIPALDWPNLIRLEISRTSIDKLPPRHHFPALKELYIRFGHFKYGRIGERLEAWASAHPAVTLR
jgi:Leucine-rich repeat (LRR) protein